jgi:hypothetical protein
LGFQKGIESCGGGIRGKFFEIFRRQNGGGGFRGRRFYRIRRGRFGSSEGFCAGGDLRVVGLILIQVHPDIVFDTGFEFIRGLFELCHPLAQGLRQFRQLLRSEYKKSDYKDNDDFGKANSKHMLALFSRIEPFPGGVKGKKPQKVEANHAIRNRDSLSRKFLTGVAI